MHLTHKHFTALRRGGTDVSTMVNEGELILFDVPESVEVQDPAVMRSRVPESEFEVI